MSNEKLIDGLYTEQEASAIKFLLSGQEGRKVAARAVKEAKETVGRLFVRLALKHKDAHCEVGKAPNGGISVTCAPLDSDIGRIQQVLGFSEKGSKKPDSWNQYTSNVRHAIRLGVAKDLAKDGKPATISQLNKLLNLRRQDVAAQEMPLYAVMVELQELVKDVEKLDSPHVRAALEVLLDKQVRAVIKAVREQMKKKPAPTKGNRPIKSKPSVDVQPAKEADVAAAA